MLYAKLKPNLYKLLHSKPFKNNGLESSTYFYTPLEIARPSRENNIYKIYIYIKIPLQGRDQKGYVEVCRSLLKSCL